MHAIYQHRTDNEVPRRLPVVEDRRLTLVAARTTPLGLLGSLLVASSFWDPAAASQADEKARSRTGERSTIIYGSSTRISVGFLRIILWDCEISSWDAR